MNIQDQLKKEIISVSIEHYTAYNIEINKDLIYDLDTIYCDWCEKTQIESDYNPKNIYMDFFKYLEEDYDVKIIGKSKDNFRSKTLTWE